MLQKYVQRVVKEVSFTTTSLLPVVTANIKIKQRLSLIQCIYTAFDTKAFTGPVTTYWLIYSTSDIKVTIYET